MLSYSRVTSMEKTVKLYTYEIAPNGLRLKHFMAYKGIELEAQEVDLGKLEQLEDSYLAINPMGTIPCLVLDDGTVLTEVISQCVYLEALYPDKPLLGETPQEKAEIMGWIHRLYTTASSAIADMLRNFSKNWKDRALPGPVSLAQIPELVDRGRIRLHAFWPQIEAHLADREYIAGGRFSQADIDLMVLCGFAGWVKESIPEDCPNLQAWLIRVNAELGT
jgi:glutathione S-transferase